MYKLKIIPVLTHTHTILRDLISQVVLEYQRDDKLLLRIFESNKVEIIP